MTRKITWHFCKNGSEELSINSNKQNYRVDLIVVQNIARHLQHVKLQNLDERTNGPAQMILSTRLYDNVNRHKSSQSIRCSNESSQGDNQIYKHTVIKQGKLLSIHGQSELKKTPVEPRWDQPKSHTRYWPNDESFMLWSSLSLKSGPLWISCISYYKMTFFIVQQNEFSNFCDFRFWPSKIK